MEFNDYDEKFIDMLPLFMCMKISSKDLLRVNKGFGGNLIISSSPFSQLSP